MTSPRRVVAITGIGAVTAAGAGVQAFWTACVDGRSARRPAGAGFAGTGAAGAAAPPPMVGAVDLDLGGAAPPPEERAAALLLRAADEAMRAAALPSGRLPAGAGTAIGTCLGGALATFAWCDARAATRGPIAPPWPAPGGFAAPARRLAAERGLTGPVTTLSAACISGTAAVAHAAETIRRGESDLMLAGGVDALSPFVLAGFGLLRALAAGVMRPFDRRRDGLSLGEGAGVLVLESLDAARRRHAPILAIVEGSGSAADAHHMTGPSPTGDGVARALQAALDDAGRDALAVDFISAHGTGTPFNDRMETLAFKRVLGARAPEVPIDSIKPIVGHTLGAAGALEAILCVKAIGEGVVPPTAHLEEPDPECDLDYVRGAARRQAVRRALSTSSAFAGHNAALLLGAA
ncbi:MAG TPA: beta-ketoacyl-[acyl-carrier-protein] synthase family protein [Dongiaceae bacterium]|nr:beta-ketoacyl-[acyl-carrier-protein] synthase family protein [Dongiaceae bacterium]